MAGCIWTYMSLDAIDGKQARRTGMSGPLGELFDHVCDAINMVMMVYLGIVILRIQPDLLTMAMFLASVLAFFAATWETYHTGVLHMGYVSAPVEGNLLMTLGALLRAIFGTEVLSQQKILGMPMNIAVSWFATIFALGSIVSSVMKVYSNKPKRFVKSFLQEFLPLISLGIIAFVVYQKRSQLWTFPNWLLFLWTFGLCSCTTVVYTCNKFIKSRGI